MNTFTETLLAVGFKPQAHSVKCSTGACFSGSKPDPRGREYGQFGAAACVGIDSLGVEVCHVGRNDDVYRMIFPTLEDFARWARDCT